MDSTQTKYSTVGPLGRVLLIRMDRIGDLVLSLPVDEFIKANEVHWWIPPGLKFVTDSANPIRTAFEIPKKVDLVRFFSLFKELRRQSYDAAVVFHAPWWVSLLLFLAMIRIRGGVKSQWHSFLFLNRSVRQKRSRVECSELEYNYRLIEEVFGLDPGSMPRNRLRLNSGSELDRREFLARHGLEPGGYSVVHPGMGGSALNWPAVRYGELIRILTRAEMVVITGTKADEIYIEPLREELGHDKRIVWLEQKLSSRELLMVLAGARTVTAPSTGVMHLSAALGASTLGLFSPVRVQQPLRWGPQGPSCTTLMPKVHCPGQMACIGKLCPHFDCMTMITAGDAITALTTLATNRN